MSPETRARIGRRGASLLILAGLWASIGVSLLTTPEAAVPPNASLFHRLIPIWIRAALWIGTALIAAWYALRPRQRADSLGFAALIFMPLERTASFFVGWAISLITGGEAGYAPGLYGAIAWGSASALIIIIAGWPEPEQRCELPNPKGLT